MRHSTLPLGQFVPHRVISTSDTPVFVASGERGEPGRCCPAPEPLLPSCYEMDLSLSAQNLLLLHFQSLPSPSAVGEGVTCISPPHPVRAGTGVAVMDGEVKQQSFVEPGL